MNIFQWWITIPWIIGLAGLALALFALLRNRYPRIRLRIVMDGYVQRYPECDSHAHLYADVISVGADVFDLKVYLELDSVDWVRVHKSGWMPRRRLCSTARIPFKALTGPPDPLKNNQADRFELYDHEIRSIALRYPYWKLPSLRWPSAVRVAVYHSGARLLCARSSWWFRRQIRAFDIGSRQALQLQLTSGSSEATVPDTGLKKD